MSRPDLPQIEFVLTDADRRQAERIAASIERQRRQQNERDRQRAQRQQPQEAA